MIGHLHCIAFPGWRPGLLLTNLTAPAYSLKFASEPCATCADACVGECDKTGVTVGAYVQVGGGIPPALAAARKVVRNELRASAALVQVSTNTHTYLAHHDKRAMTWPSSIAALVADVFRGFHRGHGLVVRANVEKEMKKKSESVKIVTECCSFMPGVLTGSCVCAVCLRCRSCLLLRRQLVCLVQTAGRSPTAIHGRQSGTPSRRCVHLLHCLDHYAALAQTLGWHAD